MMLPGSARNKSFLAILSELFERKTIKSFAYRVNAFEELDRTMQEAVRPQLEEGDPVQMMLFAPAQSVLAERPPGSWRPGFLLPWEITPERLLVLTARQLVVASLPRQAGQNRELRLVGEGAEPGPVGSSNPPAVLAIPFTDILSLESGSILLSSWTEISWETGGRLERIRIHYNTVCRSLFVELAGCLRRQLEMSQLLTPAPAGPPGQGLELLEGMPYKFRNLIPLHLLLPEEKVQAAVFRPSLWEKKGLFFKRHVAPRMALVRTGRWLILAQDDLTPDDDSYGLIAQFYPLRLLRRAALQESPASLQLVLTLSLGGIDCELRQPFTVDARPALQAALDGFL
jgi:hypothetical protein